MMKLGATLAACGCGMFLYQYYVSIKFHHWNAIALEDLWGRRPIYFIGDGVDRLINWLSELPLAPSFIIVGFVLIFIGVTLRRV
jgi:hypothetical protein